MNAIITGLLSVGALFISIISIIYTRKNLKTTKYIDTITSERIRWIETIRNEFADIITNIDFTMKVYYEDRELKNNEALDCNKDPNDNENRYRSYFNTPISDAFNIEQKILNQRDLIKSLHLLKIRLYQNGSRELTSLIDFFIQFYAHSEDISSTKEIDIAKENANELINHIQDLLMQEWEKVKNESYGEIKRKK